jgi:hypothetical protein
VVFTRRNRIIFVPGKNPKPRPEEYRRQLLRTLLRGVERADPSVAPMIEAEPEVFRPIAWNPLYYSSFQPLDEDLPWIDALLDRSGPTKQDIQEARSFRRRIVWLLNSIADRLHFLIPLLSDPAAKRTILETARYFNDEGGIGARIRELLKVPLRKMFADGDRILIIGHSMGSVIAYDTLWELTHLEQNPGKVDLFLTIGSPLGMRYTQERLRGAHEKAARRYPHNIRRWVNITSQGDITALDPTLHDDFKAMIELGLVEFIADYNRDVFNYFRTGQGLNVHRSYSYLVNPRVGEVIADWWKESV